MIHPTQFKQARFSRFDQSRETHPGRTVENSSDLVFRRQPRDPQTSHRNPPSGLGHRTLYATGKRQSTGTQSDRVQARRMGFRARGKQCRVCAHIKLQLFLRLPPIHSPSWIIRSVQYGSRPLRPCSPLCRNCPTARSTQSYAYLPPNKSWMA